MEANFSIAGSQYLIFCAGYDDAGNTVLGLNSDFAQLLEAKNHCCDFMAGTIHSIDLFL